MEEPKFRCGTKEAMKSLAQELKLPYEDYTQDWSYEVANPEDIEEYVKHYKLTCDEDKKFVLMEIIIQAINDQADEENFIKYWDSVEEILKEDFAIHEYTIFYWSCFDIEKIDDAFTITANIREVWNNQLGKR